MFYSMIWIGTRIIKALEKVENITPATRTALIFDQLDTLLILLWKDINLEKWEKEGMFNFKIQTELVKMPDPVHPDPCHWFHK